MKSKKLVVVNLIICGMLSFQNMYAQNDKMAMHKTKKMDTNACSEMCGEVVKTQTLLFKKGKVYELAFANVKPEKMEQLNKEYFPKAMPLIMKYGGKMLGGFGVVKTDSKLLKSNMVAIFEWPNAKARLKLLADKNFQKITHLRDEALSKVSLGYFEVPEDKAVTFRSDKVYEFGSANLKPGKKAQADLQEYFKVSEPIKRSYGGTYPEFIVSLDKTNSKGQATFVPHMQFIVEWDSLEDNKKLFSNHDFKTKAVPLMMRAISSFDAVFTKFAFQ